jgi:hypothetical protein
MNHAQQINSLQKSLREYRTIREKEFQKIGLQISEESSEHLEPSIPKSRYKSFIDLRLSANEQKELIQERKELLLTVKKELERQTTLSRSIQETTKRIYGLEEENNQLYVPIGEIAFSSYQVQPDRFSQYSALFRDISDLHNKLTKTYDNEKTDSSEKNPFQQLIQKGKSVADQMKRTGLIKQIQKESGLLGKELVRTEFIHQATNPQLIEAASPVLRNIEEQETLQKNKTQIEEEIKSILSFLGEIRESIKAPSVDKIVPQLENSIEFLEKELSQKLLALGQIIAESTLASNLSWWNQYEQPLADLNQHLAKTEELIAQHAAAIESKDLTKTTNSLIKEKEQLEKVIAQKQQQLQATEKEMKRIEKLYQEAVKRAGDVLEPES